MYTLTTADLASKQYKHIRLEEKDRILEIKLHTDGGPLRWRFAVALELLDLFESLSHVSDVGAVILTGSGTEFSGPVPVQTTSASASSVSWDEVLQTELRVCLRQLDVLVPIIAVVNGPAVRHAELALLCDIVLCTPNAEFMDSAHFRIGAVPGDALHIIFPLLLGPNRGRYHLLTGRSINAEDALAWGLVAEIIESADIHARAHALAQEIACKPPLASRYAKILITERVKRELQATLGYGLALAGLAASEGSRK